MYKVSVWCALFGMSHISFIFTGRAFSNWNKYLSENQAEPCDGPMFNDVRKLVISKLYTIHYT